MTKWRKGIMILLLLVGIAGSTLVISMGALGSPPRSSLTVSPTQLTFNAVAGGPPASRTKYQCDRDYTNVVYRERVGAERKHKLAGAQPFGKPDNKSNIECNREPGRAGGGNL